MRRTFLAAIGLLAVGMVGVWLTACSRPAPTSTAAATGTATPGTPSRTAWGDPDLQGLWPSTDMVGVPLQRASNFGERNLLRQARA